MALTAKHSGARHGLVDEREVSKSSKSNTNHLRSVGYGDGQAALTPTSGPDAKDKSSQQRLFFTIAYAVGDRAFERAAETYAAEIEARPDFDPARDLVVSYVVTTEADFRSAWDRVKANGDLPGWTVAEGQVFCHSSKGSSNDGLEFKGGEGKGNDGTLDQKDINGLPRLNWAPNAMLQLSSCNSGLEGDRGWSPATVFASAQGVQTLGEMGYAYFSSDPNTYVRIDDETANVYLNAYRRGKNSWFGSGAAIPDAVAKP